MQHFSLLASRAVLKVAGPDAGRFLQNVVTANIEALETGGARLSALLTPQGKILFDFIIVAEPDGFLLDCDSAAADALAKRLTLYRLRAKAEVSLTEFGVAASWDESGNEGIPDPRLSALGRRHYAPNRDLNQRITSFEADYDEFRRGLGVPQFGRDFEAEKLFLTDANYDLLGGVDYKKGCFIGQEVSSRMKRKGEIRRRMLIIRSAAPLAPGAGVEAGELSVGDILCFERGVGLALIRIDRLEAAQQAQTALMSGGNRVDLVFPTYLVG